MSIDRSIKLTSHVGRDLLAAASSFKTEAAVVWEYVVNSLQYVDEGVIPRVQVSIYPRKKMIEIQDNGRGMDEHGLKQFFTMHGENIERQKGRPGRGKFGTGKSAAFGIGDYLKVDTYKNGIRNTVELHRDDIESSSGEDIVLKWILKNEETEYPNGTVITIGEIALIKINASPVIEYIERHLQSFRTLKPEVAVNEHICEYKEPSVADAYKFKPNEKQKELLGDIELNIKVSSTPLPNIEQGISITAGAGNLVAIETLGFEKKELGNYLFGEVDVPSIENYESSIQAYDPTRSLTLNPQHPVCAVLLPFIASKIEYVRKEQLKKLNHARKTEEARRLSREAKKIADILNNDFQSVLNKLYDIRSASARSGISNSRFGKGSEAGEEENSWVEGTEVPGNVEKSGGKNKGDNDGREKSGKTPEIPKGGKPDKTGNESLDPAGGTSSNKRKPSGGFAVEYRSLGMDSERSKYDKTGMTILINLDHPAVKNAMSKGGVEDINFKRLSYEIAFTEYSVALGYEMAEKDPEIPADDLLYEVRTTLNRVSKNAASLYS